MAGSLSHGQGFHRTRVPSTAVAPARAEGRRPVDAGDNPRKELVVDALVPMRGNLVGDPRQQVTASGMKVTKFRIASNGRRFDQALREFIDTDPVYMNVTCWRQLGDNVMKSLRKGDTVIVYGRLRFSEYADANGGPRRQSYEIDAMCVGPDLGRYVTGLTRPPRELPAELEQAPAAEEAA
jgi:single-strand DNA-binding protein